jgi:aldehyde dehydrogenase (NAD(P)+)
VGSADPEEFLGAATGFLNDTLWGTLAAGIVIHPRLEQDPGVARALERAITDLRYGNVAINQWAAVNYAMPSLPWGGHQSVSPADIQSGLGWVHNTYLLDHVDKSVLRGGLRVQPTPVWFADNAGAGRLGPQLVDLEAEPRWRKVPGVLARTLLPGGSTPRTRQPAHSSGTSES